ncbi:MAG: hypothetical protein RI556_07655 [Hydrogenovibrio sp.]|uniref:hypothetical protein n=1 Tax=Hydrogenovibrio sp. TaxID=2065821 RepID=UPI0028709108|nr:hypothetical protein [Hydrogenovibrio sp.]MDR9499035.1 hypothetical protein [Hydrogenovibrio sp.]
MIVAVFLPLFPMSMLFNALMAKVRPLIFRLALLILWPQIGLGILLISGVEVPSWVPIWAGFTAIFYAFRLTVIREMCVWISFLATSSWALLWLFISGDLSSHAIQVALALSLPFVLLSLLANVLIQRYGAAYTGLLGGLAQNMPRFSGTLVFTVLAATATPVFPGFFVVMKAIASTGLSLMVMVGFTWLLWSWSAARLIQGTIVGKNPDNEQSDISLQVSWLYTFALTFLAIGGIVYIGGLL